MSSTETLNVFKLAMLKGPYRQMMVRRLGALFDRTVRVPINNQVGQVGHVALDQRPPQPTMMLPPDFSHQNG